MPRQCNIPNLPVELRAQLIMEVLTYLNDYQWYWDHPRPCSAIAELCRAIALGRAAHSFASTKLQQRLAKNVGLWMKVEPYYD